VQLVAPNDGITAHSTPDSRDDRLSWSRTRVGKLSPPARRGEYARPAHEAWISSHAAAGGAREEAGRNARHRAGLLAAQSADLVVRSLIPLVWRVPPDRRMKPQQASQVTSCHDVSVSRSAACRNGLTTRTTRDHRAWTRQRSVAGPPGAEFVPPRPPGKRTSVRHRKNRRSGTVAAQRFQPRQGHLRATASAPRSAPLAAGACSPTTGPPPGRWGHHQECTPGDDPTRVVNVVIRSRDPKPPGGPGRPRPRPQAATP